MVAPRTIPCVSLNTLFEEGGTQTIMANITRFDPVGEIVSLRSAMDRLFEDSYVSPAGDGTARAVTTTDQSEAS